MKLPLLLFTLLVCYATGYADYFPGQRNIRAEAIPGLIRQLKSMTSAKGKIDVMLNIGYGYMFKPGEEKTDLDSAMYYAQQAISLSRQINNTSLIQEGMLLSAMIFVEQRALASAKRMLYALNDTNSAKIMLCISKHCSVHEQIAPGDYSHLDTTLYYAQSAIRRAAAAKHAPLLDAALTWAGDVGDDCNNLRLYSAVEKHYLFMLQYCNNHTAVSKAYIGAMLTSFYVDKGDFYQALNYGLIAENALHRNSSAKDYSNVYINLGSMYQLSQKYEKALFYFEKVMANPEKFTDLFWLHSIAGSYCICLIRLNRNEEALAFLKQLQPAITNEDKSYYHENLASLYREENNFAAAEANLLLAIKYSEADKMKNVQLHSLLGTVYDQFGYPQKANAFLKIAEKGLNAGEHEVLRARNFLYLSRSEAALGNYEPAYKNLVKRNAITDSIYNVSKEKHTQELEVQYQTQKKETDLRLKEENIRFLNQHAALMVQDAKLQKAKLNEASLLGRQKEIALQLKEKNIEALTNSARQQKAEIAQAEAKRYITVLVIALLVVIIALLIWLFWSKIRSNKVITDKNELLQQLLTEKSWLVKEMHHRVKNNLHTVMSLLESQSAYLQNDALEAVKNSQCRIFSMSLIHQKLYQEDAVKTIDMECYIPELICYLRECFNLPRSFRIHMDIDPAEFDVSEAVPVGLIVNEAVTNSLKYAHGGEIWISLKAIGDDAYELTLADNGIGLKEGFDINNVTSLGFKLIKGLSDQLDAKLSIINRNGLKIKLSGISLYKVKQLTA